MIQCAKGNATLASIRNRKEEEFVRSLEKAVSGDETWIGEGWWSLYILAASVAIVVVVVVIIIIIIIIIIVVVDIIMINI